MKKTILTALAIWLFDSSFAQSALQLTAQDTRNVTSHPMDYSQNLQYHLKYHTVTGLPLIGPGYSSILGFRGWIDNSGGKSHEIALTDDHRIFVRSGYSQGWEGWRHILTEDLNQHVGLRGNLLMPNNSSYISLGDGSSQFPYGMATIGHGSGKNALIYHHQFQSGPTVKVDIDGYNFAPAFHVSGAGAYRSGGLYNVDYTHVNWAYLTSGYRANISHVHTNAGGAVAGFEAEVNTQNGGAYGGYFRASSSGTGHVHGIYVDAFSNGAPAENIYGVYVNRGKSFFNDRVGIGTTTPAYPLVISNGTQGLEFGPHGGLNSGAFMQSYNRSNGQFVDMTHYAKDFHFWSSGTNTEALTIKDGKIGIGTTHPQTELAVKGYITAKKLIVTQNNWADYVFEPSYRLPSLQDVEAFIKQHKHLPDVPSAKEIEEKGLDVGDNQAILLKKIEELTLYMIQLKKQVDEQQKLINELKKQSSN